MKYGVIKSSWISMSKSQSWSPKFWLKVLDAIKVESTDVYNDNALRDVIRRVEKAYRDPKNIIDYDKDLDRIRQHITKLQQQRQKLQAELKEKEDRGW